MPDCGLRLTDTQLSTLGAIKAGKVVERTITCERLMQLRLINNALQLTPAGIAVLTKPPAPKKFGLNPQRIRHKPQGIP